MVNRLRYLKNLLASSQWLDGRVRAIIRSEFRDDEPGAASPSTDAQVETTVQILASRLMQSPAFVEAIRGITQTAAARDSFDTAEVRKETLRIVDGVRDDILRLDLRTRRLTAQKLWSMTASPKLAHLEPAAMPLKRQLAQLGALHPHLYPRWEQINLVENPDEFARKPEGSCTIGKRATDEPFSGFIAPYLHGRILDVGCGPYALPLYLEGYPLELIYGIDPIEPFEPHPFTFVKSVAEFIPFPDASFNCVIAATSLDHSLSLTTALGEIRRVICSGGSLLVWDGFVKDSPRYDPDDPNLQPVDNYHFFHFDESWFEEIMSEFGFTVREKLAFDPSPHNPQYCTSFFYCLSAA